MGSSLSSLQHLVRHPQRFSTVTAPEHLSIGMKMVGIGGARAIVTAGGLSGMLTVFLFRKMG
jgi:hypothetical protein